jgi:fibronectin type 3 domain-containing protein
MAQAISVYGIPVKAMTMTDSSVLRLQMQFRRGAGRGSATFLLLLLCMVMFCLPGFSQSLAAPTGVRVWSVSGALTVYWNAIPGISTYNIYRSTTSGGEGGTPVATNVGTASGGFYYYSNTGLTNGTTYYYQVTAKSSLGESAKSAEATGMPNGSLPSGGPTHLVAHPGTSQVALTWNTVSGATWYNLFRSTNSGSTYTLYQPGLTATSYTDTSVTSGSPYYYYVSAANANGETSGGNVVSAIPGAATLPAPTGLRIVPASTQLTLYWNPVTGASGYNVYRGTSPGGEGSVPLANGVNSTSGTFYTYASTGLTNGTPYYYTVTAVNSNGEGTASAEATGVPNGIVPGTPSPLSVTTMGTHGVTSTIVLNWNAASGAISYDLFRSAGGSSSYSL